MMVERYYNEKNQMGVVYSPGFGAGWSTWYNYDIAFDKRIVEAVLNGEDITQKFMEDLGYEGVYCGGHGILKAGTLKVAWIPKGMKFRIEEYDGAESVRLMHDMDWWEA